MERFAVGICTIDDGKEGVLLYCCLVEGVQLCEFDMDNDGDDEDDNDDDNDNDYDYDNDDDADAGCPPPHVLFASERHTRPVLGRLLWLSTYKAR